MKIRKKSVVVDGVQWTGNNLNEIVGFMRGIDYDIEKKEITIPTLEGDMIAGIGDWLVEGVDGEFYLVKNQVFKKTYELVLS